MQKKRLKPGPKPKPVSERRAVRFSVAMTPGEYAEIKAAADGSISEWARAKLLAIAKRKRGAN